MLVSNEVEIDCTESVRIEAVRRVVKEWQPSAIINRVEPLTPDASLRRYFRVHLDFALTTRDLNKEVRTVVAMYFDSVLPPEAGGPSQVPSDQSYVELSRLFAGSGVSIPVLLHDARESSILLVEDVGDTLLMPYLERVGRGELSREAYQNAISQIHLIQGIPAVKGFFAFERRFSATTYYNEILEFLDFYLSGKQLTPGLFGEVRRAGEALARMLDNVPGVFVHRDFHSWNIMVQPDGEVRVIDFQDALLGSRVYDLVALLNDRDTDLALGSELYKALLEEFVAAPRFADRGEELLLEYFLVLLQRDLKVVGRFCKLASQRGLVSYLKWVPGTLRRIGSCLRWLERRSKLGSADSDFKAAMSLVAALPQVGAEISEGWTADRFREIC